MQKLIALASVLIALPVLGLDPAQLKVVFATHFHGDHAGGVPYFRDRGACRY